jgi:hypothetical protein
MQRFKILIMVIGLLGVMGGAVRISDAATTFTSSTIVDVDQAQRTVTFHIKEGQMWTLPVSDPGLLSNATVSKGDRVSIEVDLDNRISKITKLPEQTRQHPLSAPVKPVNPLDDEGS